MNLSPGSGTCRKLSGGFDNGAAVPAQHSQQLRFQRTEKKFGPKPVCSKRMLRRGRRRRSLGNDDNPGFHHRCRGSEAKQSRQFWTTGKEAP